jgi:uncharacterized protein (TIGR03435 family)
MRIEPRRGNQLGVMLVLFAAFLNASAQNAVPPQQPSSTIVADAELPVYDVAVFRPAAAENGDRHVYGRLNTLDVKNTPVLDLLKDAFGVSADRVFGLPEWAAHARFDIEAKTLETDTARLRNLTPEQRRAMMLALLEDRLGLKWHNEDRALPAYELAVANGGPKLKPTVATGNNSGVSVNDTRFRLTNIPVAGLAVVLSDKLGRPVVDKTGLTGRYDIALEWSSDLAAQSGNPEAPPPLLTAIQEQLGLKLKSGKDVVQVFVLDRLTQPTAN